MSESEIRIQAIEDEVPGIDDNYHIVLALCEIARQLARIADHYTPPGPKPRNRKKAKQ